jgi:glyoxylase-like metal-dependent hydrolase (beta-lactamase superfamily II)
MTATRPARDNEAAADKWVAPGVLAIPIEIIGSDLRHVFVYALECDTGVLLIDAGWSGDPALRRLDEGLHRMGRSVADVSGVLVTHNHSDHYGLAAQLKTESGAWIGMHPADTAQLPLRYGPHAEFRAELSAWLIQCGVPTPELDELANATMYGGGIEIVMPDRDLLDGDEVRLGSRRIQVIHTPGHSPGHLVFALSDEGVLFSGDHVLPKITPNVSAGPLGARDPLSAYLDSLATLRGLGDVAVMPAHVAQFSGLSTRLDELTEHHVRRLDETARCVAAAGGAGGATVWDVAQALRWSRPLDRFPAFLQRAALGESDAHLQRLAVLGRASATETVPARWRLTDEEVR